MILKRVFFIIVLIHIFSCENSIKKREKKNKFDKRIEDTISNRDSVSRLNNSLISRNRIISASNDSLMKVIKNYTFLKDSCVFYGKLRVSYSLLGHPSIPGEIVPTEKEFLKNKVFRIEFYAYRKNKLLEKMVVSEKNNFRYEVQLRKKSRFKIKLYSKIKGENEFHLEDGIFPQNFRTTKKDTMKYDIKKIIWHT